MTQVVQQDPFFSVLQEELKKFHDLFFYMEKL